MKKPAPLAADDDPKSLKPDLDAVLRRVGPTGYARATAADFAAGGKYAPKPPRQRKAIT